MLRQERSNNGVDARQYTTKTIRIPKKIHGAVIGKGGEGIQAIRESHRVRINFPDKESSNETVEVSGHVQAVDDAIAALTTKMQTLSHEKKLEIPFPTYMFRYPILEDLTELLKVIGQNHGVHVTTPARSKCHSGQAYVAIKGADPNIATCKRQVQEVLADVEANYAKRTKDECAQTAEWTPFEKMLNGFVASSVDKYYSAENQQKLKDFRDGKCDWEPTSMR